MATPEFLDYYKTLGVPRTATQADIKKAFRKLARESHPDKHPGDTAAERRFKAINEANAVLSDAGKRAKYDQFGADWEAYSRAGAGAGSGGRDPFGPGSPFAGFNAAGFGGTRAGGGAGGAPGGVRFEFRSTGGGAGGFSDFFHMMFGDESAAAGEPERFGSARGSRGAGTAGGSTGSGESIDELLARLGMAGTIPGTDPGVGSRQRARPAPIEVTAELSLEESYHGTSRIVELDGRRLEVTIPRGASTGSRIRLTGKGPGGADLVVVTKLKPHKVFTRRGDDLEREVPVTLREALLGSEIPVGTLKGRVLLKVPAGTQNAKQIRLKGQGMPHFKGDGHGDLFVRVRVVLPTDLSEEAQAAAAAFLDLADQPDPRV